ncbi:unnamed protein product, partial [Ectocarpus fasciculatus]
RSEKEDPGHNDRVYRNGNATFSRTTNAESLPQPIHRNAKQHTESKDRFVEGEGATGFRWTQHQPSFFQSVRKRVCRLSPILEIGTIRSVVPRKSNPNKLL